MSTQIRAIQYRKCLCKTQSNHALRLHIRTRAPGAIAESVSPRQWLQVRFLLRGTSAFIAAVRWARVPSLVVCSTFVRAHRLRDTLSRTADRPPTTVSPHLFLFCVLQRRWVISLVQKMNCHFCHTPSHLCACSWRVQLYPTVRDPIG